MRRVLKAWKFAVRWLGLALPVLVGFGLGEKRGIAMGVAAAVFYGLLMVTYTFRQDALTRWSRRHPFVDACGFVPFLFFALAYLTNLSLLACFVIAVAAGVVFVALVAFLHRRRGAAARKSTGGQSGEGQRRRSTEGRGLKT